jgi:hypothetical protein
MGQKGDAYWVLVGTTEGKRALARPEIDGIVIF